MVTVNIGRPGCAGLLVQWTPSSQPWKLKKPGNWHNHIFKTNCCRFYLDWGGRNNRIASFFFNLTTIDLSSLPQAEITLDFSIYLFGFSRTLCSLSQPEVLPLAFFTWRRTHFFQDWGEQERERERESRGRKIKQKQTNKQNKPDAQINSCMERPLYLGLWPLPLAQRWHQSNLI